MVMCGVQYCRGRAHGNEVSLPVAVIGDGSDAVESEGLKDTVGLASEMMSVLAPRVMM